MKHYKLLLPVCLLLLVQMQCIASLSCLTPSARRLSRELNVDLLINQAGYVPGTGKTVVTKGLINRKYEVVRLEWINRRIVYQNPAVLRWCFSHEKLCHSVG